MWRIAGIIGLIVTISVILNALAPDLPVVDFISKYKAWFYAGAVGIAAFGMFRHPFIVMPIVVAVGIILTLVGF